MAAPPESPAERPLRLFIAVEISEVWREALIAHVQQIEAIAPGLCRWVRPEGFHITLAFLGNQPATRVELITRAMDEATTDASAFTLRAHRLGYFGSRSAPQVIWAGIADVPAGALATLRDRVTGALQAAGLQLDQAPFRPHITLGRARRGRPPPEVPALRAIIETATSWADEEARVEDIVLVQSEPRPGGSVYTALQRQPLSVS